MAAVVQPQGNDFGRGARRQKPYITQPVRVVGGLKAVIGGTGKALDQVAVPYSVFSFPADSVTHNFHSLSLAFSHLVFQAPSFRGTQNCLLMSSMV